MFDVIAMYNCGNMEYQKKKHWEILEQNDLLWFPVQEESPWIVMVDQLSSDESRSQISQNTKKRCCPDETGGSEEGHPLDSLFLVRALSAHMEVMLRGSGLPFHPLQTEDDPHTIVIIL